MCCSPCEYGGFLSAEGYHKLSVSWGEREEVRTLGSCFPNKAILKVHVNLRIYIQENNLLIFYSTIKNTKKKKSSKGIKIS